MSKRIFCLLLAAAALLSGCSPAPVQETSRPVPSPQTRPTTEPLPAFRETTLVDDENCLFRVTAIDPEGSGGYTLNVYLENRTDKNLMFSLDGVSVNGFMCDPYWAAGVSAGMKVNETVSFPKEALARNGTGEVTQISFTLTVYDSDDWTAPRLVEEEFTVYPHGAQLAKAYTRTPLASDIVLFDNEDCAMLVTGFDPDNTWGYTMQVYLRNKTDDDLIFSISDAAVNGFLCDPYWAVPVSAGKQCISAVSWLKEDFAKNGITRVETLLLPVQVYEEDDLSEDPLLEQTYELKP